MTAREIAWQRVEPDLNGVLRKRVARALPTFAPWSAQQWENQIRRMASELVEREGRWHGPPGGSR